MRSSIVRVVTLVLCCSTSGAQAQPGRHQEPLSWDRNVGSMFSRYCYDCHSGDEPSGNVDLAQDRNPALILQQRNKWATVLDVLEAGEMPPDDETQPSDEARKLMIDFLKETLAKFDCDSQNDPGPFVLRRLSRVEYDLAILDLTGLDLSLAASFPPDPTAYGFDNIGGGLGMSSTQVELYHSAAKAVVTSILNSKETDGLPYRRVIGDPNNLDGLDRVRARQILKKFATQAFRRPADDYYVNRLLRLFDKGLKEKEPADRALGHGLTAILISPRFLLKVEAEQPHKKEPYRVSDYELASRLSFFLWSRPPDSELLELAAEQRLHEPKHLQRQVTRMLADERSMGLVDQFFMTWLDLRRLARHHPDESVFPAYDEKLRQAMEGEVRMLFASMIQEDLSLLNLIDSDFTYVNQRLATHYGLEGVQGPEHRRIDLKDKRRGGVITTAAFTMLQSDPDRTNIPRRGNFIAAHLLGKAPPPPPDDVPPLEVTEDTKQRTLRETFELHRSDPVCASCHRQIDPLGFTLENYDAIGRWRDEEAGLPIDASSGNELGTSFNGPAGLKRFLITRKDEIAHTLATRLMIFAMGRGLNPADDCVVDRMVAAAKQNDYRLSPMVMELVQSTPFTHRKNLD